MADYSISAEERNVKGKKVSRLREQGLIPGSIYGPKTEPISLQFDYRDLELTLRDAGGTNLIDLNVNGDTIPALAREVQRDVIKGNILHVDFFAVDMDSTIRAEIPLNFEGESPIVQSRQGILITGPNTLTIETYPDKLMDEITINISGLQEMGDTIYVASLDLGEGVRILNDDEEMLAKIVQPSAARALERLEAAEAAEAEGELVEGEEAEGEEGEGEFEDEDTFE